MAKPATPEQIDRFAAIAAAVRHELADEPVDNLLDEIARLRLREESAGSRDVPGPLTSAQIEELRAPLAENRIRTRKGRGGGQFQYLAGHDAKRRANEIFGFGRWGAEVVEVVEDALVGVVNDKGTEGWHVAYRAVVRVTVAGCEPVSDVGYGDGVEYGPAAVATARELAMKEAVTDAMKRALTQYGDQFGLILYAKEDEKRRIASDENAAAARPGRPQPQRGRTAAPAGPKSWKDVAAIADAYDPSLGWNEWMKDAVATLYGTDSIAALTPEQRKEMLAKAIGAITKLSDDHPAGLFPPPTREEVAAAWATVLDGATLPGPMWQMSPEEADLAIPTYEEATGAAETSPATGTSPEPSEAASGPETNAEEASYATAGDDDVPFGE
jgi:DNA recombination protein Rad52